jgi:hypothetical protein
MEIMMKDIGDVISSVLQKSERFKKSIQKSQPPPCNPSSSDSEEQQMKILHQVAIIIQKNWRGFYTRKMLREYFEQLYIDSQHFHEQNMVGLNKSQ